MRAARCSTSRRGLDLGDQEIAQVLASPRSRAVLGVHKARLRSVRSLGFAETPISGAQFAVGFASLAIGMDFWR